jgi:hypothetical protein
MKKVIALSGKYNTGKTSTLRKVHEDLLKLSSESIDKLKDGGADIYEVFLIEGVKVGIETQGDPSSRLPESLDKFVKHECKIIICACRSRGSTVNIVKSLETKHGYEISWRGQSTSTLQEYHEENNTAMSKLIVSEVKDAIEYNN